MPTITPNAAVQFTTNAPIASARLTTTTPAAAPLPASTTTTASLTPRATTTPLAVTSSTTSSTISFANAAVTSSTPFGFSGAASPSSSYPGVTTPGIQQVPIGSSSSASGLSNTTAPPKFPVAAIAVIVIVCGIVGIFFAYKIYVWWYRRFFLRRNDKDGMGAEKGYPAARYAGAPGGQGAFVTLNGESASVMGGSAADLLNPGMGPTRPGMRNSVSGAGTLGGAEGGFGSVWSGKRSSSMMGSFSTPLMGGGGHGGDPSWATNGSYLGDKDLYGAGEFAENGSGGNLTPASPGGAQSRGEWSHHSRETSPFGPGVSSSGGPYAYGSSMAREDSSASNHYHPSSTSGSGRNSFVGAPSTPHSQTRRNVYGSPLSSSSSQIPPSRSSARLSGAPHAQHSRIDIVPPLPLGPPPSSVMATERDRLDFAPSAGLGDDWGSRAGGVIGGRAGGGGGHSFPPPSAAQYSNGQSAGNRERERDTSMVGRGMSSEGSSLSSGNGNGNGRPARSSPPTRYQPSTSQMYADSEASYTSSSSSSNGNGTGPGTGSGNAIGVGTRQHGPTPPLPKLQTSPAALGQGGGGMNSVASPLDKLQRRLAGQEALDEKKRVRSERVRRANEGDDGTFED